MLKTAREKGFERPRPPARGRKKKPSVLPRWTAEERSIVESGLALGLVPSEIVVPGRTQSAVGVQARVWGLTGDGIARTPWPDEDKDKIRRLVAEGKRATAIFREKIFPGKSFTAIQKQLSRLGLADPLRSAQTRTAKRMDEATLEEFRQFLRAGANTRTPEELARLWNKSHKPKVTQKRVVSNLVHLKIKKSQYEVRRMPYSRRKARRSQLRRLREATVAQ